MRILIVGLVKSPQLARLIEEGTKRGHEVEGCYTSELTIFTDAFGFEPSLRGKPFDYDLIYLWTVGKRRWEWYTLAHYLSGKGVKIVSSKVVDTSYLYYLSPAIDYLKQQENGLMFPKSAVLFSSKSVDSVVPKFSFPLILKTSTGRQGKGVFKIETVEELKKKIKELQDVSPSFVIREFIPNDGDIRIFTVGYKAIGAMKRTPTAKGEFRSNISVGGKGEEFDLNTNPEVREMAERLSKLTRTEIAGVDIMLHQETREPYILEINPGPQFTGLEKYTSTNAALEIVKYFENISSTKN